MLYAYDTYTRLLQKKCQQIFQQFFNNFLKKEDMVIVI